ncbi:glycosyltransferase 87 family protein [Actinoplanes auranticolor]|uniref:Glycosyl transferase n=1 Tax=Actinoplanes auranticolor TaxID=47988 RepID=A0A919VVH9_9ACTN|nr:glycosyltransferase 87 family protein [Actinoplanes auranticolor]GIM76705.1 glycosyl transferase [Actinoplanes auranticolor]
MPAVEEVLDERGLPAAAVPAPARRRRSDLGALTSYLALAVLVLIQLWIDPAGRVLSHNDDDHGFFAFAMAHGERVLFHGANPLFSDRMNVPGGVNMMANTSELALSVPMAPVTHWLGVGVTVVLLLTLGLAGTAFAWYWVLSRHLVESRRAAWIGGLWCGFAPAMVSHANGHINFVSQFVVPFIVWQVLRLREPGRAVRGGVVLGLLVVLQVFINEEVLLFTALTLGAFVIAYAALAWAEVKGYWRRFVAGLGVGVVTAVVPLAYPLWFQFTGPQSYSGQPFEPGKFVTDLLSLGAYARQSLAGNAAIARELSVSPTEENTFYGVPLLVLLVVSLVLVWRNLAARAAAIAGLVLLIMSMGPELRVGGYDTGIPLPFALIAHVPVIDLVSVTRFAMVTTTIIGLLLALAADRVPTLSRRRQTAFWVGLALAIVPVLPKPLPVVTADPLPPFIAQQMWRDYVSEGRTLVTVPLPEVTTGRAGMRWFALSGLDYAVPRGYFMGPADPPLNNTGSWNAAPRRTSDLLRVAGAYGRMPVVTVSDRMAARNDLSYWRAAVVVLVPGTPHHDLLETILTDLLGKAPQQVGGVQLWDVRDIVRPSG